jgi:hypothetical protein
MRQAGWGLFSLALGIAFQVSGVEGLVVAVVAWTAVLVGVALLALSWLRHRGRRHSLSAKTRRREPPLERSLERLGREIIAFIYTRDVDAPGWESSESTLRHPVRAARVMRELRAYEADTMVIYRQTFTTDLRRLVHAMVGVHVGRNEARDLLTARTVLEAEATAQRLIQIGQGIASRRRKRIA